MVDKTPARGDRRVERTRRALRAALVELILERGWDAASVQDVCDRADVGRSTFYAHFADKEDLLIGGLEDLGKAIRLSSRGSNAERPLGFVRGLIEHAEEQKRLFRAVIGKHGGEVVHRRFRELLMNLFREELAALAVAPPRLAAAAHYLTGAFSELLTWWLESRNSLGAAELEELFRELSASVLGDARSAGRGGERRR